MDIPQGQSYNPNDYYYQQPTQNMNESSLVNATNPEAVLFSIEMALRGKKQVVNERGVYEWVIPTDCKPLMNEKGINSLMVEARSCINQNTILSNWTEEQISKFIIRLGQTIITKLQMNWKEWGIDKAELTTALFAVTDPANAAYYRAKSEGEKKFLKTNVRTIESFTSNTQGKPQGISGADNPLSFWRK